MSKIIVSVIIPVYNTEKYIKRCLNSVRNQSFTDFEVILVDDGSQDNCGVICDNYAHEDIRFRVIHKSNEGALYARNDGILAAKGEYIVFIDSDDWVEKDYLRTMLDNIKSSEADILATGYILDKDGFTENQYNKLEEGIYEKDKLINLFSKMLYHSSFYNFGVLQFMWNKIYRKEILLNCGMNIDKGIYDGEDVARLFPCMLNSKKIQLTNDCMYHYVINEDSITNNKSDSFYENSARIFLYLDNEFKKSSYYSIMKPQLNQYFKLMVWLGEPRGIKGEYRYLFPYEKVPKESNIILYAAGCVGRDYYRQIEKNKYCNIVAWVDKKLNGKFIYNNRISCISELKDMEYDYIVIAIEHNNHANSIKRDLEKMQICSNNIII